MFDTWIVGEGAQSDRRYVVRTETPRFFIEIIEQGDGGWKTGALFWLDDPGPEEARRWTLDAADAHFAVRERHSKSASRETGPEASEPAETPGSGS